MNWEQLKTILWLRWRLMCNQSRRGAGVLGAIVSVLLGLSAVGVSVASFVGGLCAGIFGLADKPPQVIMLAWLAVTLIFIFFWMIGLVTELQRSETIDLQKLMHLPVALGQMFAINFLVSHLTMGIVFMVPMMIGLGLGLAFARSPLMILMIPLALSMVFMISAWTYCLRGWLATMMSNPRRRRTVIMCISLGFILLAQGPNLYFNVLQHRFDGGGKNKAERQQQRAARDAQTKEFFEQAVALQGFVPPLWVPVGAQNLAGGNPLPALLGTLGCLGIGVLGLRHAYRGTIKFFRGDTGGKAAPSQPVTAAAKIPRAPAKAGNQFLEWPLPGVPEQAAALALATFRSLLRAPEVKMALGGSMVSLLIVGGMVFLRTPPTLPDTVKPFIITGVITFSIFILIQFYANLFGFDRDGFRSLILSPADRRLILLGKNLATLPVGFGFGVILLVAISVWLHLPLLLVAATLFQLLSLLLIASLGGNLLSILVPFRIQPGSMKPTKMPGLAMLVMMLCQMLFPLAMVPVFVGPLLGLLWQRAELPALVPVNLIFSALLCGGLAMVYWLCLAPLGRLLQSRETKILGIVTVEVE